MNLKTGILLFITTTFSMCDSTQEKADLIITNATIWTANPLAPYAESMAVLGDNIIYIGDNEGVGNFKDGKTRVVDAEGKFVTPGFIDSHVHFIIGGNNLSSVQLRDASSKEEFINRIAAYARSIPEGEWITGGDWDHKLWGGELPKKEWIDSVTRHNPVLINRLDGHMALVNSLTLDLEGITKDTKSVEGGEIIYEDVTGEPTGIFIDNAYFQMLGNAMPRPTMEQQERVMINAMKKVSSNGVTSIHDVDGYGSYEVFQHLRQKEALITRVYSLMPLSSYEKLKTMITENGVGDKWLKIGGLKGFVDGSLGSHTAAFFDPFLDEPDDRGFFVNSSEDLYNWVSKADLKGLQVAIHAIGDSANNTLLDIYERVAKENGTRDRRFRIEHAQHIAPVDIKRFGQLGVIPSVQPYHLIDDGRWAEDVIGAERIQTTYPFRSFLDGGAKIALGSDWFVAPPIPLMGIYAAVTRATLDGENPEGWVPEQKITVEEALRGYTIDAAYASFDENIKGSLEAGKLADFVIMDKNLFEIAPETIIDVKVEKTYVGGEKVFDANH